MCWLLVKGWVWYVLVVGEGVGVVVGEGVGVVVGEGVGVVVGEGVGVVCAGCWGRGGCGMYWLLCSVC